MIEEGKENNVQQMRKGEKCFVEYLKMYSW